MGAELGTDTRAVVDEEQRGTGGGGGGRGVLERSPRAVLVVAAVVFVLTLGFGVGVIPSLSGGGFDAVGSESDTVTRTLEREFGVGDTDVALLATAKSGDVDDAPAAAAGAALAAELRADPGVDALTSYWETPQVPGLRGEDGTQALLLLELAGEENARSDWLRAAHDRYDDASGPLTVEIGGNAEVFRAIQDQIVADLVVSEAIAVPLSLLLLLFVFRSVVSALLPLVMGALAVGVTFAVLRLLAQVTEVSIFALNLTSALALGLGIDYGLLAVTRFREELAAGRTVPEAVRVTQRTAGRTVLFSGLVVGLSLATLLLFPLPFLRSFAYAAIPSVFGAVAGALVVLPAMLRVLGHRIDRWRLPRLPGLGANEAGWERVARWAIRRRVPVAAVLVVALAVLALPFLHVRIGKVDETVLPADAHVREVQQELRDNFPSNTAFPVTVHLPGLGDDTEAERRTRAEVAARVSALPHVSLARAAEGEWSRGQRLAGRLGGGGEGLTMANATDSHLLVLLRPAVEVYSTQAEETVHAIRALSYDTDGSDTAAEQRPRVSGEAARLVDAKRAIADRLPWAVGLIALCGLVLTFLLTGSLVVPLKALFLNLLSLTATFGVMVWGFQDGNLEELLGFTSSGYLDHAMPVLMFCAAFGLSMDYELFLVSRIHEEHLRGRSNEEAVVEGIRKTGAVFTSAALLLAVVFAGLVASQVSIIKMAGLGIVLAILVDAMVIRTFLVPALMSMMGRANWWAPRPLRRLHGRAGRAGAARRSR
ncbi:MMPL family transporter [Streptomyces sp. 4N509B]|uniref:MMPL family transporter n=1 Tax=Streptomyces sp. 4N509B TaxID=3457413 RepID=UPI003FD4CFD9